MEGHGRCSENQKTALAKRAVESNTVGKELEQLKIGDCVQIQNQTGNYPNKWFSTGIITGVLPHRQYHVVVDGSRRISLRNRRYLRKILPVSRKQVDLSPELDQCRTRPVDTNAQDQTEVRSTPERDDVAGEPNLEQPISNTPQNNDGGNVILHQRLTPHEELVPAPEPSPPLRRSRREKAPIKLFTAKLSGKSHE